MAVQVLMCGTRANRNQGPLEASRASQCGAGVWGLRVRFRARDHRPQATQDSTYPVRPSHLAIGMENWADSDAQPPHQG
ncbi:hypothetical protein Z043_121251 [Scleropages formosus]|uniref:Uncharacterized protein n=1 Tax=Scleropages formosus TaxID=113540 RepID=A0A0P7UHU7_SCLFO|nr:hypothetical protein Z043_121251 [Scleropages formosus]